MAPAWSWPEPALANVQLMTTPGQLCSKGVKPEPFQPRVYASIWSPPGSGRPVGGCGLGPTGDLRVAVSCGAPLCCRRRPHRLGAGPERCRRRRETVTSRFAPGRSNAVSTARTSFRAGLFVPCYGWIVPEILDVTASLSRRGEDLLHNFDFIGVFEIVQVPNR